MIDFSTLQGLTIPEGVVTQIADASGRVLWSAIEPEIITLYLRPSADITINHSLYPADSTSAYLLINEEVPDNSSTYLHHVFTAGDTSTYSKTSSFIFTCEDTPQKYKIKSAKLVVKHATSISTGSADLTDYCVKAMISVNGNESENYTVDLRYTSDTELMYITYYADITDFMVNISLTSDFIVMLTQQCSDCTPVTISGDYSGAKTYNTNTSAITTAWIEVEYV